MLNTRTLTLLLFAIALTGCAAGSSAVWQAPVAAGIGAAALAGIEWLFTQEKIPVELRDLLVGLVHKLQDASHVATEQVASLKVQVDANAVRVDKVAPGINGTEMSVGAGILGTVVLAANAALQSYTKRATLVAVREERGPVATPVERAIRSSEIVTPDQVTAMKTISATPTNPVA